MPSRRRLNSVCQSIAHHAASSLSYVHPHLLQALKATGESIVTVDLLSATPYPKELLSHPHLPTALSSLRDRFEQILKSEGFLITDLNEPSYFSNLMANTVTSIVANATQGCLIQAAVNTLRQSIAWVNPLFPSLPISDQSPPVMSSIQMKSELCFKAKNRNTPRMI